MASSLPNPTAESTLDEQISATLARDLRAICFKMRLVCFPKSLNADDRALREWDLWGPLLLCLLLSITMSLQSGKDQSIHVFTSFFVVFWAGASIATVNAKLLGAHLSFLQTICVLGYSMFPILAAAVFSAFFENKFARLATALLCCVWASLVSVSFLKGPHLANKLPLALYPICLLYFAVSWMVIVARALRSAPE